MCLKVWKVLTFFATSIFMDHSCSLGQKWQLFNLLQAKIHSVLFHAFGVRSGKNDRGFEHIILIKYLHKLFVAMMELKHFTFDFHIFVYIFDIIYDVAKRNLFCQTRQSHNYAYPKEKYKTRT